MQPRVPLVDVAIEAREQPIGNPGRQSLRTCVLIVAFGGFLFGFNVGVLPGVLEGVVSAFHLYGAHTLSLLGGSHRIGSPVGLTVAASILGTLIGAPFAGILMRRSGPRRLLRFSGALFVLAAMLDATAPTWMFFLWGRFLIGIATGASTVLCPLYIAELVGPEQRGKFVGAFQINAVLGSFFAFSSNYAIALTRTSEAVAWRLQIGVAAVPALLYFVLLLKIPHSPRWLLAKGRLAEAEDVLNSLGTTEAGAWIQQASAKREEKPSSLLDRSSGRLLFARPILLAIMLASLNQLCGINVVLYYLHSLLAITGADRISSHREAVLIALTKVIATVCGLSVIDSIGRRRLLRVGATGMTLCLASSAILLAVRHELHWIFWLILAAVGFYAASLGAVLWVYLGEFFPSPVRARGQALGSFMHWMTGAIATYFFPLAAEHHLSLVFVLFAGATATLGALSWRTFPETRGVPLDKVIA